MDGLVIGLFILGVVVGLRMMAGMWDRDRIRAYVESQGGSVQEIVWAPFGTGWLGEKSDRLYDVQYTDRDGRRHSATCKTSMMTGVYWTGDRLRGPPPARDPEAVDYWVDDAPNPRHQAWRSAAPEAGAASVIAEPAADAADAALLAGLREENAALRAENQALRARIAQAGGALDDGGQPG